jgi:hypothetical protein
LTLSFMAATGIMSALRPRIHHARLLYERYTHPRARCLIFWFKRTRVKTFDAVGTMDFKSRSDSPTAVEKPFPLDDHCKDHQASRSFRQKIFQKHRIDLDSVATQPSVFDDPVTLEVYRPPPEYENTHRFDPDARWTWREEKVSVAEPGHWNPNNIGLLVIVETRSKD